MKKGLLILTLFMLFKPLFPIVEYVVNYDYISKVLCVNKETPIIGCNGKCYLMSELAKSSEDEKPINDKTVVVKEIQVLFFEQIEQISFVPAFPIQNSRVISHYSDLYSYLDSSAAFHPPSFISKVH